MELVHIFMIFFSRMINTANVQAFEKKLAHETVICEALILSLYDQMPTSLEGAKNTSTWSFQLQEQIKHLLMAGGYKYWI